MEGAEAKQLTFRLTDFPEQTVLNVKGYQEGKEDANYKVQGEQGEGTLWVWASKTGRAGLARRQVRHRIRLRGVVHTRCSERPQIAMCFWSGWGD